MKNKKRSVVFVATALIMATSSSAGAISHFIKTGLGVAIFYSLYRVGDGFCDEILPRNVNRARKDFERKSKKIVEEGLYRIHVFCDPIEGWGRIAGNALKDSLKDRK